MSFPLFSKRKTAEDRDNIIEELQYKLCKIEDQYQNMPNEFTYDEYLKQKPSFDKRNYKAVVCDVSGGTVPNNKTVGKLSRDNQQTAGINLRDNKVTGQNNTYSANKLASLLPQKAKSDYKEFNCKKSVSLPLLEKAKTSSVHRNLNVAKRPKCETSKSSLSASLPLIKAPICVFSSKLKKVVTLVIIVPMAIVRNLVRLINTFLLARAYVLPILL